MSADIPAGLVIELKTLWASMHQVYETPATVRQKDGSLMNKGNQRLNVLCVRQTPEHPREIIPDAMGVFVSKITRVITEALPVMVANLEASKKPTQIAKTVDSKGKMPERQQTAGPSPKEVVTAHLQLGSLPVPETYAAMVMKSLNARETQKAQALAANRKKMQLESVKAKESRLSERESKLKDTWGPGYVDRARRLAALEATRAKKAEDKKAAGFAARFVKYSLEQVESHKNAVLKATGASHWFSPMERKAFKKLSQEEQSKVRAETEFKFPPVEVLRKRREANRMIDLLASEERFKKEAVARRALCTSKGHSWRSKAKGKVQCSRCHNTRSCSHALNEGAISGSCIWCSQSVSFGQTRFGIAQETARRRIVGARQH